eukprot:s1266_g4.t1
MSHPSTGYGEPKCASGVGFGHMFTLNDAGRETIKNQALAGHNYLGLAGMMACICQNEETCLVCNADGSMKGAGTADPKTAWPASIQTCITDWKNNVITLSQAGRILHLRYQQGNQCACGRGVGRGTHQICSSTAYYPATDATGLVTGTAKEAILEKMCDPTLPLWWNAKNTFMPISFDCEARKSKYALSRFFAGANDPDDQDGRQSLVTRDEGKKFQTGYVEGRNGWYSKAAAIEAKYEREHGSKLRIMLFSGATLVAQYLGILLVDGFLSLGSLVSVWAYMWLMLESVFLASCGMFEIIFSLPVGMCLWVLILGQKIFWYQMLVIYMILGIGADDVFILYDAWLQSAHTEGVSHSRTTRFCWAYRRSVGAMLVTTLTTCGSFFIGATSPLPLVQSFCIFAAVVVLVDYLFCISFFASAVLVYEEWMKGVGYCCRCCGIPLREPGTCLGSSAKRLVLEKVQEISFYDNHKIKLILFWLVVVIGMATSAGVQLRTAKKRAPIGRENIDVIKGSDILFSEFEFSTRPVTASIVKPACPAKYMDELTFLGSSASDLAKPAHQLELLALCTAVDVGQDAADTRCGNRACLAKGSPLAGNCAADQTAWQTAGIYLREDESCVTSRYCFMEEPTKLTLGTRCFCGQCEVILRWCCSHSYGLDAFVVYSSSYCPTVVIPSRFLVVVVGEDVRYFWASKQGNCQGKSQLACSAAAGCAYSTTTTPPVCYSTTDPLSYPGLSESEFITLLSDPSSADPTMTAWEESLQSADRHIRLTSLSVNRRYEADFAAQYTGVRLNSDKTAIQFAWISYNATFPRENTVDEANDWYNRWQTFKDRALLPFLVTQNEMVKAATMGIGLSLLVCFIVLLLTTWNWWTSTLGLICIICITATFLGVVPLLGWSLGENECIFMIATVGLSVDYTVHMLHAYNNTPAKTRTARAHAALEEMGISVANSAITTLFAAAMLFACGFYFFFQFGGFIFMVIGLSILMSTNFLMPLLMLIGPENDQGTIFRMPKRTTVQKIQE